MSQLHLNLAQEWAHHLDTEDFEALVPMMSSDCRYESPNGLIEGGEAIADSYRRNAVWAHDTFDHIEWSSEMEVDSDSCIMIFFEDRTRHCGLDHVYHCQQLITFDADGRVRKVKHISIESEEEALAEFFRETGVER